MSLIVQAADSSGQAVSGAQDLGAPVSANYVSQLLPPPDAPYYRCKSFTPMSKVTLMPEYVRVLTGIVTWNIDAHVYTVGALPDSTWLPKGEVYVVLLHRINIEEVFQLEGPSFYFADFKFEVSSSQLKQGGVAVTQLPASSFSSESRNNSYPLKFQQDMQMFRNQGNEPFTFSALYEDHIDIADGQLLGTRLSSTSLQMGIRCDSSVHGKKTRFQFTSLSVFRLKTLEIVPFDLTASINLRDPDTRIAEISRRIEVDCRFRHDA